MVGADGPAVCVAAVTGCETAVAGCVTAAAAMFALSDCCVALAGWLPDICCAASACISAAIVVGSERLPGGVLPADCEPDDDPLAGAVVDVGDVVVLPAIKLCNAALRL